MGRSSGRRVKASGRDAEDGRSVQRPQPRRREALALRRRGVALIGGPMSEANPSSDTPSSSDAPLVVPLVGSHRLEVDTSDPTEHRLVLRLPTGGAALRVAITAAGVQLEF